MIELVLFFQPYPSFSLLALDLPSANAKSKQSSISRVTNVYSDNPNEYISHLHFHAHYQIVPEIVFVNGIVPSGDTNTQYN